MTREEENPLLASEVMLAIDIRDEVLHLLCSQYLHAPGHLVILAAGLVLANLVAAGWETDAQRTDCLQDLHDVMRKEMTVYDLRVKLKQQSTN